MVNYTDAETPYTRIIEHKHFEFGTQPKTVISREYSTEWKPGDEPITLSTMKKMARFMQIQSACRCRDKGHFWRPVGRVQVL